MPSLVAIGRHRGRRLVLSNTFIAADEVFGLQLQITSALIFHAIPEKGKGPFPLSNSSSRATYACSSSVQLDEFNPLNHFQG